MTCLQELELSGNNGRVDVCQRGAPFTVEGVKDSEEGSLACLTPPAQTKTRRVGTRDRNIEKPSVRPWRQHEYITTPQLYSKLDRERHHYSRRYLGRYGRAMFLG